jgi:hypothetical protein
MNFVVLVPALGSVPGKLVQVKAAFQIELGSAFPTRRPARPTDECWETADRRCPTRLFGRLVGTAGGEGLGLGTAAME